MHLYKNTFRSKWRRPSVRILAAAVTVASVTRRKSIPRTNGIEVRWPWPLKTLQPRCFSIKPYLFPWISFAISLFFRLSRAQSYKQRGGRDVSLERNLKRNESSVFACTQARLGCSMIRQGTEGLRLLPKRYDNTCRRYNRFPLVAPPLIHFQIRDANSFRIEWNSFFLLNVRASIT